MKLDNMLIVYGLLAVGSVACAIKTLLEGDVQEASAWYVAFVSAAAFCAERSRLL